MGNIVVIILAVVSFYYIVWEIGKLYNKRLAECRLNKIYEERRAREERKQRLIAEKPDYVIFVSDLWKMEKKYTLHYIGRFDSLDGIRCEDWDLATVGGIEYLRKDGKWYEVVDDMPRVTL